MCSLLLVHRLENGSWIADQVDHFDSGSGYPRIQIRKVDPDRFDHDEARLPAQIGSETNGAPSAVDGVTGPG